MQDRVWQTAVTTENYLKGLRDTIPQATNILPPVETQCDWLRDIGFKRVDCYQKLFELAVFGGTRPR